MARVNWNLARRVHQLLLLTALILIWGVAATSIFMANASVPMLETEPGHSFHPLPLESPLAGAPALRAPAMAEDAARALAAAQLPELQRLLRLRPSSLSATQKAEYAAALRTALHELLPDAPTDGDMAPVQSRQRQDRAPAQSQQHQDRAPAQSQQHQPTHPSGAGADVAPHPVDAPRQTHGADMAHATAASLTALGEEGERTASEEGERTASEEGGGAES